MLDTATRILPKRTDTGVLNEITSDVFDDVRSIVEDEYDGTFDFVDEDGPAFYPFGFVPTAHYALHITAEENRLDDLIQRIQPLVNAIVDRSTRQLALTD